MNQVPNAEIPEIPAEELQHLNEQFDQAAADFEKELPALQTLKSEFDNFLKDVDLDDTGWFKDLEIRFCMQSHQMAQLPWVFTVRMYLKFYFLF